MQDRFTVRQQILFLALVFFLSLFLRPALIFESDHQGYLDWTHEFVTLGISGAFRIESFNYGPAAVYLLWFFGQSLGSRIDEYHVLLRQVFFLFDLGAIFVLMRYLERSGRSATRALFVLFNLAFFYNALIWGQTDGVMTALLFGSIVLGLVGQPEAAALLFVVAFNLKPHPIVMVPVLVLVLIPTLARQPFRIVTTLLVAAGVQLVLLLPFLENGEWRNWIAKYFGNTELYPFASVNGHNLWYLVLAQDPLLVSDNTLFLNFTFKQWGFLMFALFGFVVLLPLALRAVTRALQRTVLTNRDGALVFLTAALVSLGFFFFNTEIHERYAYPAILFLGAYALLMGSYSLYILVSVAHVLNINVVMGLMGMRIPYLERLVTPELVAGLFLIALIIGVWQLYRQGTWSSDMRVLRQALSSWRTGGAAATVTAR